MGWGVIGTLGDLAFGCSSKYVLTFNKLSRNNATRWAKHDVIGNKPVLEYIGPELSTISLSIRFDSTLGVPPQIGLWRLKKMLDKGRAYTLIIGTAYLGKFVIKSVSEDRKFHTGAGVCIVAEATVELEEWAG